MTNLRKENGRLIVSIKAQWVMVKSVHLFLRIKDKPMIVCIAEKPSVGREIAAVLGATKAYKGYMEGNGYQVTWTFGHLCALKEPHDYAPEWKRWSISSLPMIPLRFGIKLIDSDSIREQFGTIEKLVHEADMVVNCGDAGQEGELIQRWVLQKTGCTCPVRRLWISSLTEESIREGFARLRDSEEFHSLYEAGLARAIGDWLLGMNATRLYTLRFGGNRQVLSIGRVQTPTLALIVRRQHEIEYFTPEVYWEVKTIYRDTVFNATKGRFSSIEDARREVEVVAGSPFAVTSVATKKGRELPPRLFDLTGLQVECNKRFAMTADATLRTIQSLYEKKITTYPRVDTTYLSDDVFEKVPNILQGLSDYTLLTAPLRSSKLKKSKKVFDNSKITDHHAIIPTGQPSHGMSEDERRVFDLVARRFIAVFYPDCIFSQTTVLGQAAKVEFKTTGKQILEPGWRTVFTDPQTDDDGENKDEEKKLPIFSEGESGVHTPEVQEKTTQPPKFYTEATLLRAMETAGKSVKDEELRDALKENGIGRPSTRAAIIETLFKRNYIYKEKKNLKATPTGMSLIATIDYELLKSAELTGQWEYKLRRIERGDYSAADFINELKVLLTHLIPNVLKSNSSVLLSEPIPAASPAPGKKKKADKPVQKQLDLTCPVCGKGIIVRGREAFGCNAFREGCTFRLPYSEYPASLSDKELVDLLSSQKGH